MCTKEMIGPDGMPINGGPQVLSERQVRTQRAQAASRSSSSLVSTIQAEQRGKGYACGTRSPFQDLSEAAGSCEPTTQISVERSRSPTPLNSDDDEGSPREMSWDQERHCMRARKMSGREGGLVTVSGDGSMDTRGPRRSPPYTTPT
jgi:hypothetical protein